MKKPKDWKKKEKWAFIKGYGTLYSVSNMGRIRMNNIVRTTTRGSIKYQSKILQHAISHKSAHVGLCDDITGKRKWYQVKNLVADHWIRPRNPKAQVILRSKKDLGNCWVGNLKEKGTKRSLKSIMNVFGLDFDKYFDFKEYGGPRAHYLEDLREQDKKLIRLLDFSGSANSRTNSDKTDVDAQGFSAGTAGRISAPYLTSPFLSSSRIERGFPNAHESPRDALRD